MWLQKGGGDVDTTVFSHFWREKDFFSSICKSLTAKSENQIQMYIFFPLFWSFVAFKIDYEVKSAENSAFWLIELLNLCIDFKIKVNLIWIFITGFFLFLSVHFYFLRVNICCMELLWGLLRNDNPFLYLKMLNTFFTYFASIALHYNM